MDEYWWKLNFKNGLSYKVIKSSNNLKIYRLWEFSDTSIIWTYLENK